MPGQAQHVENIIEMEMGAIGVEALGAETVLIFEMEGLGSTIFVKADRFVKVQLGERIRVNADFSAARLFDPQSRQVIASQH